MRKLVALLILLPLYLWGQTANQPLWYPSDSTTRINSKTPNVKSLLIIEDSNTTGRGSVFNINTTNIVTKKVVTKSDGSVVGKLFWLSPDGFWRFSPVSDLTLTTSQISDLASTYIPLAGTFNLGGNILQTQDGDVNLNLGLINSGFSKTNTVFFKRTSGLQSTGLSINDSSSTTELILFGEPHSAFQFNLSGNKYFHMDTDSGTFNSTSPLRYVYGMKSYLTTAPDRNFVLINKGYADSAYAPIGGGGGGAPSGPAGGSLSGTYPNPGLANNSVNTVQITDDAVIFAKIQDIPSRSLMGNTSNSASSPNSLYCDTGLSIYGNRIRLHPKVRDESSTNYTLVDSDDGYLIRFTSNSFITLNMPSTGLRDQFVAYPFKSGSGNIRLVPAGTLESSKDTIVEPKTGAMVLKHNATNWIAQGSLGTPATGSGGSGISGLTTNRIPYASSSTSITDEGDLLYDPITNRVYIGASTSSSNGHLTVGGSGTGVGDIDGGGGALNVGGGPLTIYSNAGGFIALKTNTIERLRILNDGSWQLAGSAGTTGQQLTSNGTGNPPTWQNISDATSSIKGRTKLYSDVTGNNTDGAPDQNSVKLALDAKESVLTFTSGLTRAINTITNDVITGTVAGNTIVGSTATTGGMTYKTTTGVGTTGADHVFKVGNNGATEAMRIFNNARIGFGANITAPSFDFTFASTSNLTNGGTMYGRHNGNALPANIHLRKSRGTFVTPTTVVANDYTGSIIFGGFTGTSYTNSVVIGAYSEGTLSDGTYPQTLFLNVNPTGTAINPISGLGLKILSTGRLNVPLFSTAGPVTSDASGNLYSTGVLQSVYGGTGTSGFVTGSVLFGNANSIAQDNNSFFWDVTRRRLGIGTPTPLAALHVTTSVIFDTLAGTGTRVVTAEASGKLSTSNNLNIIGNINTANHFTSSGATPTFSLGSGAGTGASASVSGNDMGGKITITTGTVPSNNSDVITLTFASPFGSQPFVTIGATDVATLGIPNNIVYASASTTTLTLGVGTVPLTAATTYVINYNIAGR